MNKITQKQALFALKVLQAARTNTYSADFRLDLLVPEVRSINQHYEMLLDKGFVNSR